MQLSRALVIKNRYPYKQSCVVISPQFGKTTVVFRGRGGGAMLSPGVVFEGEMCEGPGGQWYHVSHPRVLWSFNGSYRELVQLHVFFEFYYYFLFPTLGHREWYDYLITILRLFKHDTTWMHKVSVAYLVFGHFFMECGYLPPDDIEQVVACVSREVFTPVDFACERALHSLTMVNQAMHTYHKRMLKEWIQDCITSHPNYALLRAMRTLFFDDGQM